MNGKVVAVMACLGLAPYWASAQEPGAPPVAESQYHRAVGPTKAEVLEMLDAYARLPKPSGPLALSSAYLRAIERWEGLPENAAGADKSWVSRCQRDWGAHFAKARVGR
jgi:hypothetical protein